MSYIEEAERKTKQMIVEENEKLKEEIEKLKSDIQYLKTLSNDQYKTINDLSGKLEVRERYLLHIIDEHENLVKSFSNFSKLQNAKQKRYEEIKLTVLRD